MQVDLEGGSNGASLVRFPNSQQEGRGIWLEQFWQDPQPKCFWKTGGCPVYCLGIISDRSNSQALEPFPSATKYADWGEKRLEIENDVRPFEVDLNILCCRDLLKANLDHLGILIMTSWTGKSHINQATTTVRGRPGCSSLWHGHFPRLSRLPPLVVRLEVPSCVYASPSDYRI